jgi:L,D-transpeptidase ErfK/SrfK
MILPPEDLDLVGELHSIEAHHEDTLLDIARRYGVGRDEIVNANPAVDPWLPGEGTRVLVPTRYILPNVPREGLVVNLPEMRLFYFPSVAKGQLRRLITYPVSVGRMDWKTPLGVTRIVAKQADPAWRPPASVRREHVDQGDEPLPEVVPAGPDNPLGKYALRLAVPGYLIHGTNKPFGIGMRVTHGCMRLYPEDIDKLFHEISVNTKVTLVNEPVKLGWLADTLFVEIHPPLEEDKDLSEHLLRYTLELIYAEHERRPFVLDGAALKHAVEQHLGIPVPVSRNPTFEASTRPSRVAYP